MHSGLVSLYFFSYISPLFFFTHSLFFNSYIFTLSFIPSIIHPSIHQDLLAEKCPRLSAHFERLAVDLSLFTFNWFLCLFVDTIPPDVYLKIWDTFLYEGPKVGRFMSFAWLIDWQTVWIARYLRLQVTLLKRLSPRGSLGTCGANGDRVSVLKLSLTRDFRGQLELCDPC